MVSIMRYVIKFDGKEIGAVIANHSMTDEEICEMADVKLMVTQEDFENEDGYDLNDLEIVTE